MESKKKEVQRKITEHFERLPVKERQRIEMKEIIENRLELQRLKKELWKHRGERRSPEKKKGRK